MHAGRFQHVIRACRQGMSLGIRETVRRHQFHPGETHGADGPRRTADVARMRGAHQHEAEQGGKVDSGIHGHGMGVEQPMSIADASPGSGIRQAFGHAWQAAAPMLC
ncbi:hypothetical protein UU5_12980 [Rhodanobacter sp. 115]|nr:hypothetical protein UU5_12980 [Rhodanobacter sp. 115]